jgi:hypothetical protein
MKKGGGILEFKLTGMVRLPRPLIGLLFSVASALPGTPENYARHENIQPHTTTI